MGGYRLLGEKLLGITVQCSAHGKFPVKVEGNRYCYSSDERVIATYKYYLDGLEISKDEAQPDRDGGSGKACELHASIVCCELLGHGANLFLRETVDGQLVNQDVNLRSENIPVRLLDGAAGYKLRLYR